MLEPNTALALKWGVDWLGPRTAMQLLLEASRPCWARSQRAPACLTRWGRQPCWHPCKILRDGGNRQHWCSVDGVHGLHLSTRPTRRLCLAGQSTSSVRMHIADVSFAGKC